MAVIPCSFGVVIYGLSRFVCGHLPPGLNGRWPAILVNKVAMTDDFQKCGFELADEVGGYRSFTEGDLSDRFTG